MDMVTFVLMVLFSTPKEPEPHFEHGYFPREHKTLEICLKHRSTMQNYISANIRKGARFKVFCVVTEMHGYAEALAQFRSEIGDPT